MVQYAGLGYLWDGEKIYPEVQHMQGRSVAVGIYIYRLATGRHVMTGRAVKTK